MSPVTHRIPGLVLHDHSFTVPLDHSQPTGGQIEVFAREVVATGKENDDLPWLLFLQGGPGFESPRPAQSSGWLKRALQDFRVVLLDMRGTGRSTPVLPQTPFDLGPPEAQAAYLQNFRADAIIQDAEAIRRELAGGKPWTLLGQSYGGFCALHYLSAAPHALAGVLFTGGLPPLDRPADDVYRATYRLLDEHNRRYFQRYPADQALADQIAAHLTAHEVYLPTGDRLTPHRFQQLGILFGMEGGYETVHYLLETAFVPGLKKPALSYLFLRKFENAFSWDTNPLYALLHESIYCQEEASNWSAARLLKTYPQFIYRPDQPLRFTGEMVYPWMFRELAALQPWAAAADLLAGYEHWPRLYDLEVLACNQVPSAAAVYYDDLYVARRLTEETIAHIPNLRPWITNEHAHSALRLHGEAVLDRLLKMVRGEI